MNRTGSMDEFNRLLLQGCTYFVDDLYMSELELLNQVNPYELPPKETADVLIEAYFSTIFTVFPIISQREFMTHYNSYWQLRDHPNNNFLWVSILNAVFALGALHSHCVQASYKGPENDHIIYSLRARMISQELTHVLNLPTMEHIQLTALTGMYFIASYQINR